MSNLRNAHSWCSRARAKLALLPCVCALVIAGGRGARAETPRNPIEALAEFITAPPDYRGPTRPFPDAPPRPAAPGPSACAELTPVCVHAPAELTEALVARALGAVEDAYLWLEADGWPLPHPDGGRGGGAQLDVYLTTGEAEAAGARADAPLDSGALDAAITHAVLDAQLPQRALQSCAAYAIAQAGLLAHDPAEPDSTRRALAAFATWRWTAEPGCGASLQDAQASPHLGLLGEDEARVASAALFMAMISRRHDGDTGAFIRGAAELARQHSERTAALHARPTVWQALSALLEQAGESLDGTAEELTVARYFAADERAADSALPRLPRAARVPSRWAPPVHKLPKHLPAQDPPLATYGSAYVRVDTSRALPGTSLEVWLRGEAGPRWAMTAVRIDGLGQELGRVSAPARKSPESFLPVDLTPDTAQVLIAVTKLPFTGPPPQPPDPDTDAHSFKLILDAKRP